MKLVKIADKYVQCSLQLRNFDRWGVAASDMCQHSANSGVKDENESVWWRCQTHEGVLDYCSGTTGPVVYEVLQKD